MARRPAAARKTADEQNRQVVKQAVTAVGGMMVFALLALAALVWFMFPTKPSTATGPFRGVEVAAIEGVAPSQSFPIFNGFTLEVYDPASDAASPVVQLRDDANEVRWTILADAIGPGSIDTLRFQTSDRGWTRTGTVVANVNWSFGFEQAYFHITGSGDLRDYWISK